MRSAPEVMPPILLFWPMTSEADVDVMAEEAEPSHQYSITFSWCVTDGSTGTVWHIDVWYGSAYEAKVSNWIPPCWKNCTCWHSLMLAACLWRPSSRCWHSKVLECQPWNVIAYFVSDGSHECSYRNRKNTICKIVRTYWTNTRLKLTVSWSASLPVMRCSVITTSWSENISLWSGNVWIPHQRKSSRHSP